MIVVVNSLYKGWSRINRTVSITYAYQSFLYM